MVKTTKSAVIVSQTENLESVVVVPLNDDVVKTEKTKKEKKPKKSVLPTTPIETPTPTPVVEQVVVEDPVGTDPVVVTVLQDMPCKIADFNQKYNQVVAMLSLLRQSFKSIEKTAQRDWKNTQKVLAKKNKKAEKRPPSGFVRPCLISDEMAGFLELEVGTMIARTTVSKMINLYIRNNNLQDKTHGRNINPDEKLSKLLNVQTDSEDKLTYFNLQRYMKHHFIKAVVVPTPDATL